MSALVARAEGAARAIAKLLPIKSLFELSVRDDGRLFD
jgi:hypothetical protein